MPQGTLFRTLLCVATQQVMGNKPSLKSGENGFIYGVVAQLAERFLCKEEDEGSNPFCSTKDSGFPHSTDVDNPEWIRNSSPFLPRPRKTTIKQLRLERDGYSKAIFYFWSVSPVGVDACLSRRRSRVRVPYGPLREKQKVIITAAVSSKRSERRRHSRRLQVRALYGRGKILKAVKGSA